MDYEHSAKADSGTWIQSKKEALMVSAELKQHVLVAIDESPRISRMDDDITELKADVKVLKQDVAILKQDVAVLKQDVAELKHDVAILKQDVEILKRQMGQMMALMEEFNTKLTLALEMLQHCVHMIPAVHKHDLQFTQTKTEVSVTQSILSEHIQNQEIHLKPKRGRSRKVTKGTPEDSL